MFTHSKRYMVITKTWNFDNEKYGKNNYKMQPTASYDEYDTIEEVNEHIDMVKELYQDIPIPTGITEKVSKRDFYENIPAGSFFWGYIALDFKTESILEIGGQGDPAYKKAHLLKDTVDRRKYYDMHFRKNGEIPDNYKWDAGEYEGWLQYRWGDHMNAIGCDYSPILSQQDSSEKYIPKHNTRNKSKKTFNKLYNSNTDYIEDLQDEFDAESDKEKRQYLMDKYGW